MISMYPSGSQKGLKIFSHGAVKGISWVKYTSDPLLRTLSMQIPSGAYMGEVRIQNIQMRPTCVQNFNYVRLSKPLDPWP